MDSAAVFLIRRPNAVGQAGSGGDPGGEGTHESDGLFLAPGLYLWGKLVLGRGGTLMLVFLDLVVLLNFLVDFLLLVGTNRLAGYPLGAARAAAAAVLGGIYGGACLLPGFHFLGNLLWRLVSLGLMGGIAFGFGPSTLRRCVLFVLLSMALGGVALGFGGGSFTALIAAAGCVAGLCAVGFRGRADSRRYIPVELEHHGKKTRMAALYDTGNTLRDPVSGAPVLVTGSRAAWELLGLSSEDLADPVMTAASRPGFRLIPYRAVGKSHGLLLGSRVDKCMIDGRERSVLIAFAPEGLGAQGEFEALIGGAV